MGEKVSEMFSCIQREGLLGGAFVEQKACSVPDVWCRETGGKEVGTAERGDRLTERERGCRGVKASLGILPDCYHVRKKCLVCGSSFTYIINYNFVSHNSLRIGITTHILHMKPRLRN